MSDIILTDEQDQLIYKLKEWFIKKEKPYFSYSGAAGTGKTTVIREFIKLLNLSREEVMSAAYVGKAVLVLLRHGLPASTIHSLIYQTYTEIEEPTPENGLTKPRVMFKFKLKNHLYDELKLIIIDEATMVNDKMKDEILSFGIPTIFIGDMNQLPPIFGVSSVMLNPDFILTQIMRQAEDDPIVILSQQVLNDEFIHLGNYGTSKVVDYYNIDNSIINDYDIIICGKNKTRDMLNTTIRRDIFKQHTNDPVIGDKIICRKNNWDIELDGIYLTNGMIGYITAMDKESLSKGCMYIDFTPDFLSEPFENITLDYKFIMSDYEERAQFGIGDYNRFEYGYAITAHLSQGSEYDRVLFIDEPFWNKEMTRKLRYTAITRAKDSITLVKSTPRRRYY